MQIIYIKKLSITIVIKMYFALKMYFATLKIILIFIKRNIYLYRNSTNRKILDCQKRKDCPKGEENFTITTKKKR